MSVRTIDRDIGASPVRVMIGRDLLGQVGAQWAPRATGTACLVVHDAEVAHHAAVVAAGLEAAGQRVVSVAVPSGEPSKCFAQLERLTRAAAAAGIRRSDTVVGVGGGVLGDLAGFVAASYQRGVALVNVPTTLLAMVDSSIGGKTAIDLPEGKNYVGAIWQPRLVVSDLDALATLPAREMACGFAEVIKYGLLESTELFARIEQWPALPGDPTALAELVHDCVAHKLRVVQADEREGGLRASLNLGHTVGHGIEAAGLYRRYTHGEAISLGMLAALRISEQMCGLDPAWRRRSAQVMARHGLPTHLDPAIAPDDILTAMGRDKKADALAINMVLLGAPGDVRMRQNPPHQMIVDAIEELRTS